MEDENTKEENQPSTSKKESQRTNSGNDLYDDRGHDDRATNSETSVSATYSVRSRIDMTDARPEVPKPTIKTKAPERKKRGRRTGGRVEKRRRSFTRRQVRRAPLRRKPRPTKDKDRELSVSTIFTRLSSRSGSRTPGCIHCGHRCCRRR
ncbi:hypothetical protein B5X24_HaOG201607 [Helicoverpa armigera]|nr:uncharacterized protein LOC126055552 [Helicoverpa armigera]PZC87371.1 hypothetical protein B5X24_HaOG201607 [Helicoverpa armigera]